MTAAVSLNDVSIGGAGAKRMRDAVRLGKMKTVEIGEDILLECDIIR